MWPSSTQATMLRNRTLILSLFLIIVLLLVLTSSLTATTFRPREFAWIWRGAVLSSQPIAQPATGPMSDDILSSLPIDWSQFAYTQYVTDLDYLCNAIMLFNLLNRYRSEPERVLMYPEHFHRDDGSKEAQLLRMAQEKYKVKLQPISIVHMPGRDCKLPLTLSVSS